MPLWIVLINLIMIVTWTKGLYHKSIAIRTISHNVMKAVTTLSSAATQHSEPSLLDKIIVARGLNYDIDLILYDNSHSLQLTSPYSFIHSQVELPVVTVEVVGN
jgi:hypothetical protein